ncbi:MAG TPA: c-type cytochrome [Phenylobacterium sp.]|nr:c-type cytochrome [Phenylobacterium sp.]
MAAEARGGVFARKTCARCHSVGREGASPDPRPPPFAALTGRYVGVNLQRKLTEIAETGHYEMPALLVHCDDVDDIAAYLDGLNRP